MKIPFGMGHYKGRSTNINAQECINFYPEIDEKSRHIVSLVGTPGLSDLGTVSVYADKQLRGLHVFGSNLYAVAGSNLYSINSSYTPTELGALNTATGFVEIYDDGDYIVVCDGTDGYTYKTSTTTYAQITDGDFLGAASMTFQDGYHIAAETSGQKLQISSTLDPTNWGAADYTTVDGESDNLTRIISNRREVWCFGQWTTEVYYNTGATFPFERIPGAFLPYGIMAYGAACRSDNAIYWLDHNRRFMRTEGLSAVKLSTSPIDYQLESYDTVSDCIMYSYTGGGATGILITYQ